MNSARLLQAALRLSSTPALNLSVNESTARNVEAELEFYYGGGRTRIAHQRVPYPFHVTRAFYLDPALPDLATLYLQSASGGLYRGDRLTLRIRVGSGAAAHVTTQAGTIVHDTRGQEAVLATHIAVDAGSLLAYTPEMLILFPDAAIKNTTELILGEGASVVLADGFTWHDLDARGRAFDRCELHTVVRNGHGSDLVYDRGTIRGTDFLGSGSPAGPYRAFGTLLVLGKGSERLDPAAFEDQLDAAGCLAGISPAPNAGGFSARVLAPDGGTLAGGLRAGFALAFAALTGVEPTSRRK